MSRWYRAYEGTVSDGKLAEASLVAGVTRSVAVAAWHCCLENAAVVNDGGRIDVPTRRIAAILCEPFDSIETLFAAFEAIGLIRDSTVSSWGKRQYESDNSTERSRKHRKRQSNDDATLQDRCATPPETENREQRQKEVSEANASAADAPKGPSAIDLKAAVFNSGVALLMAAGDTERNARSMIGRWCSQEGTAATLDALAAATAQAVPDPKLWIIKRFKNGRDRSVCGVGADGYSARLAAARREEAEERACADQAHDPGIGAQVSTH